jgi:Transposase IS200 like
LGGLLRQGPDGEDLSKLAHSGSSQGSRSYVGAVFALIEGITYAMKPVAASASSMSLDAAEPDLLNDESYALDPSGNPQNRSAYLQLKADSSNFINKKRWRRGRFSWQEGYGAFSYGHSQLDTVIRYIQNQEQHHRHQSFKDEYLAWLKRFEIPFEEKYIFQFIE